MLVDKINAYLSTSGLEIPEAMRQEIAKLAVGSFASKFGLREERKQKTPYFSSIGKCLRAQAYDLLGFEPNGKEIDSRAKMIFFQGDMVELAVIQIAKLARCNIADCGLDQETLDYNGMRGRADGILILPSEERLLVEVKSMPSYRFEQLERGVIDDSYRYQCNAGMLAASLSRTVFVAMNKDSGVLHEAIIDRDSAICADIEKRLETLKTVSKETLPVRPYAPDAKGFYPWCCRYCAHFKTCLPNSELVLVKNAYKLKEKK